MPESDDKLEMAEYEVVMPEGDEPEMVVPEVSLEQCMKEYRDKYNPKYGPEELIETMCRLARRSRGWRASARVPLYGKERLRRACIVGARSRCRLTDEPEPASDSLECNNLEDDAQPRKLRESELFTSVSATVNFELLNADPEKEGERVSGLVDSGAAVSMI